MDAWELTATEAARLLGVDESTVRAWARRGRLRRREDLWARGRGQLRFTVFSLLEPTLPPTPKLKAEELRRLCELAAKSPETSRSEVVVA